jgi:spore germination protein KC
VPAVRILVLSLLTLMAVLTAGGCWGSRETDEVAYILSIGLDRGEQDRFLVTISIANPQNIAGAGAGGAGEGGLGSSVIMSVESSAVIPSLNLFETSVDRQLSLLHTKAYIISEELAREGLHDLLLSLIRYRELRGTALVLVSRGSARDFIEKNKPLLELSPTKQFELIRKLTNFRNICIIFAYFNASFILQNRTKLLQFFNKQQQRHAVQFYRHDFCWYLLSKELNVVLRLLKEV